MLPQFDNTDIAFKYRSDKDLKMANFLFGSMKHPFITRVGIAATNFSLKMHLPIKPLIRKTIFNQFCGGESIDEAAVVADTIGKYHVGVILDYGVEGKEDEGEFDKATREFVKAIDFAASRKNIPFVSLKVTGFARFALLEKIHAAQALTPDEAQEWHRVHKRIDDICSRAAKKRIMILIDAEETWIQEPCNELTEKMMEKFNRNEVIVFNTYQLYSHGTLEYLKDCVKKAESRKYLLGAKLVRGAYMEKERERAGQMGYTDPIQPDKESTDRDYDAAVIYCLQNLDKLALFIGTHNEKSCRDAAKYMQEHNIAANHQRVYFSQLYGMGDNLSFNLAHEGYQVSKYLPYGPVNDVIPYLMRRAQENTSVAGQTGRELELIRKEIKRRGV
jgi:proline dehydrogenase